jgi:hypothetical protein
MHSARASGRVELFRPLRPALKDTFQSSVEALAGADPVTALRQIAAPLRDGLHRGGRNTDARPD